MFEIAYKSFSKLCPCLECIVKVNCNHRFKTCNEFKFFLMDNQVRVTEEARKLNDYSLTPDEAKKLEDYRQELMRSSPVRSKALGS